MKPVQLTPIGVVRSSRKEIADDGWDGEKSRIELNRSEFSDEALAGLAEYSHVEILFYMDQVDSGKIEKSSRHPRGNREWPKVGIFAQRAKDRPNQIGVTVCRILGVDGGILDLEGLDAVDGTPVLDIKPWVAEFGPRGAVFQPRWMSELMEDYWQSSR